MDARALLTVLRTRGVALEPSPEGIRYAAPHGAFTPELRAEVAAHKAELLVLLTRAEPLPATFDADMGAPVAVWLRGTVIGDVWLVADAETLAEQPDIVRSALPVIFFDEVAALRGKTADELRAIGVVKSVLPTARVLQ